MICRRAQVCCLVLMLDARRKRSELLAFIGFYHGMPTIDFIVDNAMARTLALHSSLEGFSSPVFAPNGELLCISLLG